MKGGDSGAGQTERPLELSRAEWPIMSDQVLVNFEGGPGEHRVRFDICDSGFVTR